MQLLFTLLCIFPLGVVEGWGASWSSDRQSSDEEESDLHRYVIEHGLWTPDPRILLGPYEEEAPRRLTKAKFITANNTITTVQVGTTGALRCQILDVADHETVSWVRRRDHHLITLGSHTYTNDDRFYVSHSPPFKVIPGRGKEWTLYIKYVQTRDSGVYECQLSAHPPMGILTTLMVIQPISYITGGPDLYAQEGSDVTLLCRLKNYTIPPTYVFWYHGDEMINYDADRKVDVVSRGGESELRLTGVAREDSGNYTCVPANAKPSSITLHIIAGETPAAMQRAAAAPLQSAYTLGLTAGTLVLLNLGSFSWCV
ncbi:opioid-binding protein/cell adhesion molecule homolog [Penaeus japonicus]|uniref:opioid-binding protein/cell adhesion molecule homolog n=1 Tax=Penaeus japonicus TaxID=27405 RepID=UPI001C7175A8|nr:opioid-binding protein/cell adhesion molecule homolog [Penaeus japonicus]